MLCKRLSHELRSQLAARPPAAREAVQGGAMIGKPSRLARDVSKWERRAAKRTKKQAEAKQAVNRWRAISALVKHRDGGKCRVCAVYTATTGDPRMIGAAHHIVFRSAG